jgi:protein-S-isoprenylcysteine O-methyltransferase Ste14
MPSIDTIELAYGIPLIVVVPAIVQIAKANGLPARLAGPAAIVTATVLIALGDLALATSTAPLGQRLAGWLIAGIVYGLAAAGFYSLAPRPTSGTLPSSD